MGDVIVLAVLAIVIALVIRSLVISRKKGTSCCGNCSNCAGCSGCQSE